MRKLSILIILLLTTILVQSQNVGIGTTTPVTILDVNSPSGFTTKFNANSTQMYIGLYENNFLRGYMGSYSGAAEDVDFGTGSGNPAGKLHFTIQAGPKMTIDNAGNVGIGTTSPSASALLDMNSTTKGFLMPRMTTAQRSAIASPALGLSVFDTDTKTIWAYDGTAWKNLYSNGGGLTLPFSQTVNTAISAFQITNQGTGAAIEGSSTVQFGTGVTAKTTGDGGWSLLAFSNGAGSQSVRSYADNGTAFHGENNNPANTNTLMNLLNKGAGKTGSFQLANNSSTSPNVQIAGNHLGEQLKVYQTNASNSAAAISIENSGTGEGVHSIANNGIGVLGNSTSGIGISGSSTSSNGVLGTSSTNYGVKGIVTNSSSGVIAGVYGGNTGTAGVGVYGIANFSNGAGVYGTSAAGTGVGAFSGTNRAVSATSNSGTALYGNSTTGYALETVGNIKISGGNTNPSAGAVLTSDASGNAVWKKKKIAFKVQNVATEYYTIPNESEWKLMFSSELYDYGNNFEPYTGGVPGAEDATFIASVNGLYHFDIKVGLEAGVYPNEVEETHIILRRQRGNSIADLATANGTLMYNWSLVDHVDYNLSTDVQLQTGDKLWVIIWHDTDLGADAKLTVYETFSGHLVFED